MFRRLVTGTSRPASRNSATGRPWWCVRCPTSDGAHCPSRTATPSGRQPLGPDLPGPVRPRALLERCRRVRRRGLAARLGSGGRAVASCSGIVPVVIVVTGPGPLGAGPVARPGRHRRHDLGGLRLRVRPGHGRGLHRGPHRHPPARGHGHARPVERAVRHRGGHRGRRHGPRGAPARACCRPTPTSWPRSDRDGRSRRSGFRRRLRDDDPGPGHQLLRRAPGGRRPGRRRRCDRAVDPLVAAAGHRPRTHRRPHGRASWPTSHRPWPARSTSPPHRRGAVRPLLRRLQPAPGHPGRHPGLPARQGPRVAGDDPPRGRAGLRLRRGHRAPGVRHPAQGLRRGLHRHGLEGPRQRPVLRLAGCRDRRHGGRGRRADPPPPADAEEQDDPAGRVRRAVPHPVAGGRAGVRRRGDRSRRHPAGGRRCPAHCWRPAREQLPGRKHTVGPL